MLDAVSMFSDELMESMLEESVTIDQIKVAIRAGTLSMNLTPVFMGSAYKNKGVQLLLDGVNDYLPNPTEVRNTAVDLGKDEAEVVIPNDRTKPLVALAFKLEDGRYGQLTYIRVYQGTLKKGDTIYNMRTNRKHKVGRLIRMHAAEMQDIEDTCAGDIVALFGVECASGDTFTDGNINVAMTSMHIPEPVISLSIKPKDQKSSDNMGKALGRFVREDPTFRSEVDQESNETVISGMGELHLEVYVERMKREYNCEVETGQPQVAFRETVTQKTEFTYTHKKQTGGSGQYGKVGGYVEPIPADDEGDKDFQFVNAVRGGSIPTEYIPAVEKGFRSCLPKGRMIGFPVIGMRIVVNDGAAHSVDSSEMAFQAAARGAFREFYPRARAADPRADHEALGRRPVGVPGRDPEDHHAAARPDHRLERRGRLLDGRLRGPALGDVRLRDGSALDDPGQGGVHDGVRQVHAGPVGQAVRAEEEVRVEDRGRRRRLNSAASRFEKTRDRATPWMSRGLFVSRAPSGADGGRMAGSCWPEGRPAQPSSRRSIAERAGFVWLMPPEAESPPAVVEGPRSRFATPAIRVCTSMPVPAGTGREAFFTDFAFELAFFFVAFAPVFAAAFFVAFLPAAFFAVPFLAGLFRVGFLLDFLLELLLEFLAAFDFLPEVRAAMLDFPSRSWFFDVRARA